MLLYVDPSKVSYLMQGLFAIVIVIVPIIVAVIVVICIVKSNKRIEDERNAAMFQKEREIQSQQEMQRYQNLNENIVIEKSEIEENN